MIVELEELEPRSLAVAVIVFWPATSGILVAVKLPPFTVAVIPFTRTVHGVSSATVPDTLTLVAPVAAPFEGLVIVMAGGVSSSPVMIIVRKEPGALFRFTDKLFEAFRATVRTIVPTC